MRSFASTVSIFHHNTYLTKMFWKKLGHYKTLVKFKVVYVMLLTCACGMLMTPQTFWNVRACLFGLTGITCAASGAAILNHLFERVSDKKMHRTRKRPLAAHSVSAVEASYVAGFLIVLSTFLLYAGTNLTATATTFLTTLAYGGIYTVWLKPATPQNIVIGGLSGAMPPLLGWLCLKPSFDMQPLLMVLIIFLWTPAHFWPLAIHYQDDYTQSELPMLPNTHGVEFTKLCILAYTLLTLLASLLPVCVGMNGAFYGFCSIGLNMRWLWLNYKIVYNTAYCLEAFRFSIWHIALLFGVMLIDTLLL